MEILVFGAGSLGSLLGGLLARTHEVTLVGRKPHVDAIQRDGLSITGAIETTVTPTAVTSPTVTAPSAARAPTASADLALVTVKAFDTPAAARSLADVDCAVACSLQNGLDNEAILAEHLDCPVLAGTCTYGARLTDPGHVECTGIGEVVLGPREGGESALADEVGAAFDASDIVTTVADDLPRRLWEKLAVNAAINPTTALARVPNGALGEDPAATIATRVAREVARVARANDVSLSDEAAVAATERVIEATANNRSSMLQDVEAGQRTEIDAINGTLVERASAGDDAERATPTPLNELLAALIRAWESNQGLR